MTHVGGKTTKRFSLYELLQSLVFSVFTSGLALLLLHQARWTPRLDAYLQAWFHSHSLEKMPKPSSEVA
jgi:hypothetical protein